MEITFQVRNKGNRTLLLYFSGWGTTPEAVSRLSLPEGWDYCAFHDYRVLPSVLPDFSAYERVYLLAWSMGVWAADRLSEKLPPLSRAVAVNGTPLPMHDLYGIPIPVFEGTLRGLDEVSREKFDRRMVGGKKLLDVYKTFHARSTEDLKGELLGVYNCVKDSAAGCIVRPRLPWSRAFVSERDLIIPPANQTAYWSEAGVPVTLLEGEGHYPFLSFASWIDFFPLTPDD